MRIVMPTPAFFLHIPRTAGTTLNAILRDNYPPEEVLNIYSEDDYKTHATHSAEDLTHIRLIQGHLLLPDFDPPSIYGITVRPFTFVREPVSRLLSEYRFLSTWKGNHMYAYLQQNKVTFRDYLTSPAQPLRYRGHNFMTRCIAGMDVGTEPLPRKALARAKSHLEKVFGFVGIQEYFMESLLLLKDFLGLRSVVHEKRNALAETAKSPVPDADLLLANELNQADSALYQFACDLFQERVARQDNFEQRMRDFTFLNNNYQKVCSLLLRRTGEEKEEQSPIRFGKDGLW